MSLVPGAVVKRGRVAAFCLLAATAAPGFAQSIKIPDLRNQPESRPQLFSEACGNCGVIRSIREIQSRRPADVPAGFHNEAGDRGLGSTVVVGAVAVLPVGDSGGQSYVGGVGTPEMRSRFTQTSYEITVRLDNGSYTVIERRDGAMYSVGDRVRVQGVQLEIIKP
jgi:outer membrane lipoprotein SlyB